MLKNTLAEYGSVAKFFHWVIAALVIGMLAGGFFLEDLPEEYKATVYNLHKLTGLLILLLMVLRAVWNLFNVKPLLAFDIPIWQRALARLVHLALYVFVIAMPLVGWIGASAAGRPPHIGDINFLFPVAEDKEFAKYLLGLHGTIAFIIIGLLVMHIGAALYHHVIKRDNTLIRMMPKKSARL